MEERGVQAGGLEGPGTYQPSPLANKTTINKCKTRITYQDYKSKRCETRKKRRRVAVVAVVSLC